MAGMVVASASFLRYLGTVTKVTKVVDQHRANTRAHQIRYAKDKKMDSCS
jgi:hypothetical protein